MIIILHIDRDTRLKIDAAQEFTLKVKPTKTGKMQLGHTILKPKILKMELLKMCWSENSV